LRNSYTRVSKQTLSLWRNKLEFPANPDEFRSRVEEILHPASVPAATLFNQGGLGFLKDAHIASRVATALSADTVRLSEDRWPDFELTFHESRTLFEATEADIIGRRRGIEYLGDDGEIEEDPVENWRARLEAIPAALNQVISKKVGKRYSSSANLVLYVNLDCYGAYLQEGKSLLYSGTRSAKDAFVEVFALWEGRLFSLWKNGQINAKVWNTARVSDL
jgi:hypothetical protein